MKTPLLLGIAGRARAGKDTFASALLELGFKRAAFADPLKEVTALIADEPSHLYFGEASKEEYSDALGMIRRTALQGVGNSIRQVLGAETWVNRVIRRWKLDGCNATVVTDVRYPNEAEAITREGGYVIRINRPGLALSGEQADHVSENPLPDELVDIEVFNTGSQGELKAEARKILIRLQDLAHMERLL
jgi:hypothetical protein